MAQLALRWILMHDGVTCAIPGAKRPDQVDDNVAAADLPPLGARQMQTVQSAYDRHIRRHVHARW
jgi:aryl-alcohol dehydrogenase-like predicted oxidoreductase